MKFKVVKVASPMVKLKPLMVKIEEVVIKLVRPCVFIFSQKDNLAIPFGSNDDSKYLIFGPSDKMRVDTYF